MATEVLVATMLQKERVHETWTKEGFVVQFVPSPIYATVKITGMPWICNVWRTKFDWQSKREKNVIWILKSVQNSYCGFWTFYRFFFGHFPKKNATYVSETEGEKVKGQGCINCAILLFRMGARGVSSEHVENMEMFSCSPTCALILRELNQIFIACLFKGGQEQSFFLQTLLFTSFLVGF